MPAEATPLNVVVYDGHFDKVHYALAMAAAAAAIDRPACLFFTMDACRALMLDAAGDPAWRAMPTTTGELGGAMDDRFAADRIATFEELLASCAELGASVMVCEMGLKARGLEACALRTDIKVSPGGLVTFLSGPANDGQLVFV